MDLNELLEQEQIELAYQAYRNAPRNIIVTGVRPNAIQCLKAYENLQTALNGGDGEIIDISSKTEQFSIITASVTPFIALLQAAMQLIILTPQFVDQVAASQGMTIPPFGVNEPVNPADYIAAIQNAITVLQTTLDILT